MLVFNTGEADVGVIDVLVTTPPLMARDSELVTTYPLMLIYTVTD